MGAEMQTRYLEISLRVIGIGAQSGTMSPQLRSRGIKNQFRICAVAVLPIDSVMKIKIIEYDADFIASLGIIEISICTTNVYGYNWICFWDSFMRTGLFYMGIL